MRLSGAQLKHVRSWTGPLIEDAEPDELEGVGALDDGLNTMARTGGLREVRGGSAAVLTFADVAGNPMTDVLGVFPYSPSGLVAITHAAAGSKHYAYALTDAPAFATGAEATSRVDLGWNTAAPHRPLGMELFEKLYVVDATEAGTREGMAVLTYSAGSWSVATPTYDLDTSSGAAQKLRAYCAEVFNGVLFVSGYDSETTNNAPHLVRHSLLGSDPAGSGGFDPRAYAIIGAKGQMVRGMKAGRSILLVAKDNELYAISGTGRALPGWHYGIQPIDNTIGAGCTNPYAIEHALGFWYGMGRAGPWRCDGARVESLLSPRRRSWRQLDLLEKAVVRYHADRRQVWFYVPQPSVSGYADAPNVAWVWDIEREQWDTNQRTSRSFHYLHAIAQAPELPAAAPSSITQVTDYGQTVGLISSQTDIGWVWATFTQGDVFAQTEVWVKVGAGAYTLQQVLPAGVKRFGVNVTAFVGATAPYSCTVKVRHVKGAAYTDYSSELMLYARLRPPTFAVHWRGVSGGGTVLLPRRVTAVTGDELSDLYADTNPARFSTSWVGVAAGTHTADDSYVTTAETYECYAERTDWLAALQTSRVVEAHCGINSDTGVCTPKQVYFGGLQPTTVTVVWAPARYNQEHYCEYRVLGSGSAFTVAATLAAISSASGAELGYQLTTITGLTAGTQYEVRVRNSVGNTGSSQTCFTALPMPTSITATTNGSAGSPSVPLAIVVPASGHGLRVYNAARTYDNLTASASAGTVNLTATVGVGGTGDRYYARTYNSAWPTEYQFSPPVSDDITDPETTGS